jgi:SAM-dependent methyltransferase
LSDDAPADDILDLIADEPDSAFADYFDPTEFETRAWLEDQHYWHLYRREVILDVLRAAGVGGAQALLELGCGAGTVTTFLNGNGLRVDYSDVHREALKFARQRARARLPPTDPAPRFVRVDITRRLPPGDYDGVLLLDVLEHLPDDRGVMRAVRALLTRRAAGAARDAAGPSPFVLFTVPAFQQLWSPWDDRERHKRRYTRASARALAADTGFEVVRSTYFFFPLFFAAAAVKAARTTRDLVRGPAGPVAFESMAETTNNRALNAVMLRVLAAERRLLERRDLPLGTSVLVLARPTR